MNHYRIMVATAALAAAAQAAALESNANGSAQWVCGGAGEQERIEMKDIESQSNAQLLFVTEKRGGYLADVDFVVRDQKGATVLQGRADGPKCLLTVPAGRYRVEATYEGSRRSANFQVARAPGKPGRTVLTFPLDRSETIASSPEEKAGVTVK
jgi:hypothetical protein